MFYGIDFETKRRMKAFFSEGRLTLVLKMAFPYARLENEKFNSSFNSFYEALYDSYLNAGERISKQSNDFNGAISFTLEYEEKSTPVGEIHILRKHRIRLPSGEILRFEAIDVFDSETGRARRKPKGRKPSKKKKS